MRPVEKFIRFLGKLVIFCFVAGIILYFMQTKTLWLFFAFAGVFLTFPYMFLGVLIAVGTTGERSEGSVDGQQQKVPLETLQRIKETESPLASR